MKAQNSKLDYTGQQVFIGLDVHKRTWKVATCTEHTQPNRWPATIQRPFVDNLKRYLDRHFPGAEFVCAYEAGFSGFWAQKALEEIGIPTKVAHSADIPTSDKERKQKEDKRDARKIANALKKGDIGDGIYVPSQQVLEDRDIVRDRYSEVKCCRRVKNQIKSHLAKYNIEISKEEVKQHWSKAYISRLAVIQKDRKDIALKLMLKRLEYTRRLVLEANRALRELSKAPRYKKRYGILISVPGIGSITAMLLLTELVEMERFSCFDRLCSYVGFIPTMHSSADKEKRGNMTRRSKTLLRSGLVESAWAAIKSDPELLLKYEVYCQKMTGQEAIVRIARILLRRIRCVWLSGKRYKKVMI